MAISDMNRTGRPLRSGAALRRLLVIISLPLLFVLSLISLCSGVADIGLDTLIEVIGDFNPTDMNHLILRDIRVPRVISSILVGMGLAVSGAIMQGLTRNPLADSGLLGINAGAGLALALVFSLVPGITYLPTIGAAFVGAAVAAALVNSIAAAGGRARSPLRLVLSGAAVAALCTALSQGIALYFDVSMDVTFWTLGGVSASTWTQVIIMTPFMIGGSILSIVLAPGITIISLGEDIARSLGVRVSLVRAAASALVALLAGISVSVVGAVGFVGLMVPHISRFLVGSDYRNIIPLSAVLGALLLVVADLGARSINPPAEIPLGALIAVVGVPFFLALSRTQKRGR